MFKELNDRKFTVVRESYIEDGFLILSESDYYVQFYQKDSDGNIDLIYYGHGDETEQKLHLLTGEIEQLYKVTR